MDFSTRPSSPYARFQFVDLAASSSQFWVGMLFAALIASVMTWIGLHAGRWMARVRR